MMGLLVSVRSADEAAVALAGGADIIDLKEPRNGSLGAADPRVWREVIDLVAGRAIVSAALGELFDGSMEQLAKQTWGLQFAKIGLAGCGRDSSWLRRFGHVASLLPRDVQPVPVAYADWEAAAAPPPTAVLQLTAEADGSLLLVDTHDKQAGNLLIHLDMPALANIARQGAARGVRLALAGSLDEQAITQLSSLTPAYFGVRGAACSGGRDGVIDLGRVKSLAAHVGGLQKKLAS